MTASGGVGATSCGGSIGVRRRLRRKVRVDGYAMPSANGSTVASSSVQALAFALKEANEEYVIVRGGLDEDMLKKLEKFLQRKQPQPAKMKNEGGESDDERKERYDDRDSLVCWFSAYKECRWLHERFAEIIRNVANKHWPLLKVDQKGEVQCEYEETQYTVYGPAQHFKAWHQDAFAEGHDPEDARQFTIVTMLSRRSDYTGGSFQAKLPDAALKRKVIKSIPLDVGDCLVFPAKRLPHRVCPVKTGTRKTMVFWAFDRASCRYHTDGNPQAPLP
mmetsp:Transcript_41441/g.117307  ORF Transcript_41441/g.117307 Transcript_41441/m.117307 type:complete len:276 (-) Transcript_41441:153-980(-)